MGIFRMGPDWELLADLNVWNEYPLFIETGTLHGNTTIQAAQYCKKAVTIELSNELYEKAKERFESYNNIDIIQGSSDKVLEEIAPDLTERTVFWLDAHWSRGLTAGEDYECPVLEEIEAIKKNKELYDNAIIMIDDARLFMSPPPQGHKAEQWPTIRTLINHLDREIFVFEDCIYCIPKSYQETFIDLIQNYSNTRKVRKTFIDKAVHYIKKRMAA